MEGSLTRNVKKIKGGRTTTNLAWSARMAIGKAANSIDFIY